MTSYCGSFLPPFASKGEAGEEEDACFDVVVKAVASHAEAVATVLYHFRNAFLPLAVGVQESLAKKAQPGGDQAAQQAATGRMQAAPTLELVPDWADCSVYLGGLLAARLDRSSPRQPSHAPPR